MFLALSGGLQDAYTYNVRDHVFSNAQTGNVVLMSQHIISGDMRSALRYLVPLVSFVLGVYISEEIHLHFKDARKLHWRQSILLLEIIILTLVGFLPEERNMLATVLVSFACAMQVQSFRKVGGYSYASTMCIGNLRSGTTALTMYFEEHKPGAAAAVSLLFWHYFLLCHWSRCRRCHVPALWNHHNLGIQCDAAGQLPADVSGAAALKI